MKLLQRVGGYAAAATLLAALCSPVFATVQIVSVRATPRTPQTIGTTVVWTVTATDTNPGPLRFQFSVAAPGGPFVMARGFNTGTLASGTWTSPSFAWTPTGIEGAYRIQVIVMDFVSGESASKTGSFQVTPLVTGSAPVVAPTANPLVALFSAPSCAAGSLMRVHFQRMGSSAATTTNWMNCHPPNTMTFEIAGMYPSTAYRMNAQTRTAGKITNGSGVSFTTGALPAGIPFPTFTVNVGAGAQTDTTDFIMLHNLVQLGGGAHYPSVATDLAGHVVWYYYSSDSAHYTLLTRPLKNGGILAVQNGIAWNPAVQSGQFLREIDLAGNIVRETNTGAIQQELLAMGVVDAQACDAVSKPAAVGAACLDAFHHDAVQSLPNGYTAALVSIEKIFPPGTQGDISGLPVDILGDMIVVLDQNWHVKWYFDTFDHDTGAPQLDINRPAVRGETCGINQGGCPPILLLGPGVAPLARDWLHANTIYYWPPTKDLIWSSKNQDWVMKVDYNNGSGTGNILWRMGLDGDFTFNNINNDPWPWFSAQHEVGMENNGAGPLSVFDNGDTRISPPPLGVGSGNSRGMVLTVDETRMQVTPVLSDDLGVFSTAGGSAQLLPNGNYFFWPAVVLVNLSTQNSFSIEILPTPGTITGTQVLNVQGPGGYRGWRMPSMYSPPTT